MFEALACFARTSGIGAVAVVYAGITVCQAAERTVAVAQSDCRMAIEHVAVPDVAYRPGVDAYGRLVTPAEVEGADMALPDVIPVFISADVRDRFGLRRDSPLLSFDASIGVVDVELASGRLSFNGIALSETDEQALAALCREATTPH